VAVVRPPDGDPLLEEVASRIRSELAASGAESRLIDCAATADAHALCPGPEAGVGATIALAREDGVVEIDVRAILPDGFELGRHVRVLARDGGDDPSVLAVRAVELLRDIRLNAQRHAPAGPQGPAQDAEEPKPLAPPPPEDAERRPPPLQWRLFTGVAALAAPGGSQPGFGPALGAALGAAAVLGPHLSTVLTVAGPFNTTFPEYELQTATLLQALATLELRFRISRGGFQQFASVLSGVNYLRANVVSTNPAIASSVTSAWVPLFGAGGGVSFDFWQRFTAAAELEVFATAPSALLEANDGHVFGRAGAPSILASVEVGVALP
jgi:hypothetical protein